MRKLYGTCPTCERVVRVSARHLLYSHTVHPQETTVCSGSGNHVNDVVEKEYESRPPVTLHDDHYVRAELAATTAQRRAQDDLKALLGKIPPKYLPAAMVALRAELNKSARQMTDIGGSDAAWRAVKARAREELERAAADRRATADMNRSSRKPRFVEPEARSTSVRALRGGLPTLGRHR